MNDELRNTLTVLLSELGSESLDAWEKVLPAVYDQLKGIARKIAGPHADSATISPTVLVHEAWAKLAKAGSSDFVDRRHFFAVAAVTMRRILIDAARHREMERRYRARRRITLSGVGETTNSVDLLDLDEALTELATLSSRQARVVELRFFVGLTVEEVADCLKLSRATIESDWRMARAWLGKRL